MTAVGGTADLETLLAPRSVAIVGASNDRSKVGGQALHVLRAAGYAGQVYPVNPNLGSIDQLACYGSIRDVPDPCDAALIAVPAGHVNAIVDECGARGIPNVVVLTSGFTAEQEERLREQVACYGIRMVGPNCQGIMNLQDRVLCGFGAVFAEEVDSPAGAVAIISQSGNYAFSAMSFAKRSAGMTFGYIISTGNEVGLTSLDFLEHMLEKPTIKVVAMYMEGVKDGRRLLALGRRALELRKPILVWKAGNSRSGRTAALSHTANVTSTAEVYRAVFREGGFVELTELSDLADVGPAFLAGRLPKGRRIGVISQSGGSAVMTADACERYDLNLPPFSPPTVELLKSVATDSDRVLNPTDMNRIDGKPPDVYNHVVATVLADPAIDQLIMHRGSVHQGAAREAWIESLVRVAKQSDKPLLVSLRPSRAEDLFQRLAEENVPIYGVAERAAFGAASLADYAGKLARNSERIAVNAPPVALDWPAENVVGEREAKRILASYGIPSVREAFVAADDVSALTKAPLAFPVVVKLHSPDLHHKTEAGGVRLNVTSLEELKAAYTQMTAAAREHHPGLRIDGILVQEMIRDAVEMIVGIVNDPHFGPVVALGLGGIFTEVLKDVTHRLAPVDAGTVKVMLGELRAAPLLHGVRGRPAADVEALADAVSRISRLAADHADRIAEIDVNPLFVRPAGRGVAAADALIVLKSAKGQASA